ncbi:3-hydroxyacyl-CoA dehydrogenase family protein [Microlunatus sp. GCM10028923]|uniref:3-hydroxyacyl-CoA dehydrogenase family protein n=1 Tax=Microlunatus sp. GCM10028923 TaxID=3273400 RepID=UPI0036223BA8
MSEQLAVVGGGYMGGGIAQTLALAGFRVALADVDAATTRDLREKLITGLRRYAEQGLVDRDAALRAPDLLTAAGSIEEAVAAAVYVSEAVPEDLRIKRTALAAVDAAAPERSVIATNTSSLPLDALAEAVGRPLIAAHWFNPAPFLPLVELAGEDEEALALAERLLARAGKVTVRVPAVPGFLANRLQFALFREAAMIVEEGLATPEQVDLVVSNSFGYRLPFFGPFQVADIAGLDVYAASYATLVERYGDRFSVPPSLAERVAAGDLGLKTSGGYRQTPADRREPLQDYRDHAFSALAALRRKVSEA